MFEHPVYGKRSRLVESSSNPKVSHASGVHAIGSFSGRSSRTESVSCARSTRRLDRELRDLAVALSRVPVAHERPVQPGSGRKSVVRRRAPLQSMLPPQERGGAVAWMPGASGGMPMAQERAQRNAMPLLVDSGSGVRVERPVQRHVLPFVHTETLVEWRVPTASIRGAPRADPDLVGQDFQRLTAPRPACASTGPARRVARVALVALRQSTLEGLMRVVTPAS